MQRVPLATEAADEAGRERVEAGALDQTADLVDVGYAYDEMIVSSAPAISGSASGAVRLRAGVAEELFTAHAAERRCFRLTAAPVVTDVARSERSRRDHVEQSSGKGVVRQMLGSPVREVADLATERAVYAVSAIGCCYILQGYCRL